MTTEDWFASTKRPRTGPTSSFTSTSCATGKRCATNGRTSTASSRLFWRRRERHSPSPRLWTRWSGAKDPKTIRALALVRRQRRVEWLKFIRGVQVTSDNLFPTWAEKTNRLFPQWNRKLWLNLQESEFKFQICDECYFGWTDFMFIFFANMTEVWYHWRV